jgi:hypothetical protein
MFRPNFAAGLLAIIFALATGNSAIAQEEKVVGTVAIDQVQVAFLASGNFGGGTLTFEGKAYPFKIGGLGVGGIGVSSIEATGDVYKLTNVNDFGGGYVQTRAGFAFIDKSAGGIVMENNKGVLIRLSAKRKGVMLSVGVDGIVIQME